MHGDNLFYPLFCDSPWDFSVKDTSDDVRLIFHMWIALFYSRSMPRFFDFDSDPCTGSVSPPHSDLKDSSLAPDPNVKDTSDDLISTPTFLATSETSTQDQSSIILDLSQKNSISDKTTSVSQVFPKKTCETLNTPLEQQAATPSQVCIGFLFVSLNNCFYAVSTAFFPFCSVTERFAPQK